jgi:4,5-DOPA dioxygenase extradiol
MRPPAGDRPAPDSLAFREWAHTQLMSNGNDGLLDWEQAPGARYAHPSSEHFLPIFVALGAAGENRQTEWLEGGWIDDALAADNYLFNRSQ